MSDDFFQDCFDDLMTPPTTQLTQNDLCIIFWWGLYLPWQQASPSQGEWRIAAGRCTCFREELMPESMPGWPISKKREIKDPVPSTNDGWGSEEGGRVSLFVCFPLPFRPPSVLFYSQTLSVNLVSTANPVRITNEDYWTGSCGFFLGPCVPVCIYVCMEAVCVCVCVGVRVCLTCLWNKNVLVCS